MGFFGAKPSPFLHIYGGKLMKFLDVELIGEGGSRKMVTRKKAEERAGRGEAQEIEENKFLLIKK